MVHISLSNSVCQLRGLEKADYEALQDQLSYIDQQVDYQFHRVIKQLRRVNTQLGNSALGGDGKALRQQRAILTKQANELDKQRKITLLNDSEFPAGLLPRVLDWLESKGMKFDLEDKRVEPKRNSVKIMNKVPFPDLRHYQKAGVKAALVDGRGILEIVTGGGKTLLAAKLIWTLGVKTLIITPSKNITDMMEEVMVRYFGGGSVEVLSTKTTKLKKPISICNIQALIKISPSVIKDVDAVFIDEFHRAASATYQEVNLKHLKNAYYRIGLSVSGSSLIYVKKEDKIQHLTIGEFAKDLIPNEIKNLQEFNLKTLAWDADTKTIKWTSLDAVHKYVNTKKLFKINTQFGRSLVVTSDHSIMMVEPINKHYINNTVKYDFQLKEKPPTDLKVGDLILISSKIQTEEVPYVVNLESIVPKKHQAFIDVPCEVVKNLKLDSKTTYRYLNVGKFGSYLPSQHLNYDCKNPYKLYLAQGSGTTRFKKRFEIDESLAKLMGYYLGDGFLTKNCIVLCAANKDVPFIKKVIKGLKQNFPDIRITKKQTKSKFACEIVVRSLPLFHLFKHWYGAQKAKTKSFVGFEYSLPNAIKKALLKGLEQSDGHITKKKSFVYTSCSELLSRNVCLLLNTLGYRYSTYTSCNKSPNSSNISKCYRVYYGKKINKNLSFNKVLRNESFIPVKITSIEQAAHEDFVYDLSVTQGSTFVANDILVHNTATPFRNDGADLALEGVLSEILMKYTAQQAIKEGYLVQPEFIITPIKLRLTETQYQKAYREGIVENRDRNDMVKDIAKENKAKKVLILVQYKEHGELLKELIPWAEFIHGEEKDAVRQKMMRDFKDGDLNCLIGTSVIGEGVDLPCAEVLIMAGGGKARSQVIQNIGRVLRIFPNKSKAVIYDFTDQDGGYLEEHALERQEIYQEYTVK